MINSGLSQSKFAEAGNQQRRSQAATQSFAGSSASNVASKFSQIAIIGKSCRYICGRCVPSAEHLRSWMQTYFSPSILQSAETSRALTSAHAPEHDFFPIFPARTRTIFAWFQPFRALYAVGMSFIGHSPK